MHEGQGWGPLGELCRWTHTQQPDQQTPWLLGRDAQESSYRPWSSLLTLLFFSIQVQFCFFLHVPSVPFTAIHMDRQTTVCMCMHVCVYLNLRLYSKTTSRFDRIIHSELLVSVHCVSVGFFSCFTTPNLSASAVSVPSGV